MFLFVVDAISKQPEIVEMTSTTAAQRVKVLCDIIAGQGLLEQLISDSESQSEFCRNNASNIYEWPCTIQPPMALVSV